MTASPQPDAAAPLLLFDSGVGGLSVLKKVRSVLPDAPVIYVADNAGLPYGDKTEAQIAARVSGLLGRLTERLRPRLVCIACNTASTIALAAVREVLEVPIVGTVPAPAAWTPLGTYTMNQLKLDNVLPGWSKTPGKSGRATFNVLQKPQGTRFEERRKPMGQTGLG